MPAVTPSALSAPSWVGSEALVAGDHRLNPVEQLGHPLVPRLKALQLLQDGDGRLTVETAGVAGGKEDDRAPQSLQIL